MNTTIRIATRQSKLALWQANFIRDRLMAAHEQIRVELVGITTKGDRWLDAPLSEVGGKGLFVKELEAAMLAGEADIAVHSMKDVPAILPEGFVMPIIAYRDTVEDVLITRGGGLADLAKGARVGSASLRRQAQLLALRDDLNVVPIRGNVDTRLSKLNGGEYDAIVLAHAGLKRLELDVEHVQVLSLEQSLPAPGQAALGIECLEEQDVQKWLKPLIDEEVGRCVQAERAVSAGFGADCSLPVAAHAILREGRLHLSALIASVNGRRILRGQATGTDPITVGADVVGQLFDAGAQEILDTLRA
ncbi:MAG: hydroxymethylbilane synthase [Pseudomonadota bacterium]|nr:hydroxymethylbilane synthase [Pseudomonadota bacterium]